mmetsp:Transcript_40427/g.79692  ORF Transcript_40427/g.79692 Transcript_40427/m.79692 type:complete len:100 (-) Transcript_40427:90-389(-)
MQLLFGCGGMGLRGEILIDILAVQSVCLAVLYSFAGGREGRENLLEEMAGTCECQEGCLGTVEGWAGVQEEGRRLPQTFGRQVRELEEGKRTNELERRT